MKDRKINYKPFYSWVRMYAVGKISRSRFELEWKLEQRNQGIKAGPCVSR
jgi:hypothetical protein